MSQLKTLNDRLLSEEDIVISGMSGLFPESHNMKELSEILYNKINPVTDKNCRWDFNHPEGTSFMGKIPEIDRFDSQFFKIHYEFSNSMDPMSRKMLEHTYQAIYDAGLNPQYFKGKKVAVFVAVSMSEAEIAGISKYIRKSRYSLMGSCRTMFANRISYWLKTNGSSVAINDSCCGSIRALEQAYLAIKYGGCEAAIIGSSNLRLLPHSCIHYKRLIEINNDGKTKSFDQNADGCSLSDAINVLVLQKAKDALRVYAEILHVKCEFMKLVEENRGYQYQIHRKPGVAAELLKQFYAEAQVLPQEIEFVEALGSATPYLDKMELEAIENVFLQNRIHPLYVGSVTSNIGFTEGASGISSIMKVLLGYEKGEMAANLHYSAPRQDIKALREGTIKIISEHQHINRTYIAVNGVSVTGVISHVLLHGRYKKKDLFAYKSDLPYLVLASGRRESGIFKIIEELKAHQIDPEELALLRNIHSCNISGHLARGYVILDSDKNNTTVSLAEKAEYYEDTKRPLWFVASGMGAQWLGMGTQLMRIPIFAAAIKRCQSVLDSKGIDVINIITSMDNVFDNILNSFVGNVAVQIGLTDILRELGLRPDGIIGHSTGELVCAYIDDCLTAEETILGAYYRGLASIEIPLPRGAMAAVGLGYREISRLCPPKITVACHNGTDTSTIAGPVDEMNEFVADLTRKGIFVKSVESGNLAFHTPYVADAAPILLKYTREIIKKPKLRSKRWLSTSVENDKLNAYDSKYCTAEYFTNNLVNPVLFEEALQHVPQNAVLVEIAPHGLLQAILRRSLPKDCRQIPLTRREHSNNVIYLLQAIGNLFVMGYNPKIEVLYPKVKFPVSTGTPMLSHLTEWMHDEIWQHLHFTDTVILPAMSCNYVISIHDEEYSYLQGHVIRGATVFPFAAALVAAWDIMCMSAGVQKRSESVEFHELRLYVQPLLLDYYPLRLTIAINQGTGWFEITEDPHKYKVITGYISRTLTDSFERKLLMNDNHEELSAQDIYRLLQERDYSYSGEFCSIQNANADLTKAELTWCDNWVTFIDGMLQLSALRQPHYGVSLPTYIRKLTINLKKHSTPIYLNGKTVMKARIIDFLDQIRCGGVSIYNTKFQNLPAWKPNTFEIKLSNLPYPSQNNQNIQYSTTLQEILPVLTLKSSQIGDLNSLQWVESSVEKVGIPVNVHYAGLSKRDIKKASSDSSNVQYGMDFSGTLESGQRVMGIVNSGAASNVVMAQPEMLWPVPDHWSLEDAATVPLAYAQALYCLKIKLQLLRGMAVFIEKGIETLGQAAISIALAAQCRVMTTVLDIDEKQFLLKVFPGLKDEFVFVSNNITFMDDVNIATKGEGCDVIISYSKGIVKTLLLNCVALSGTFIDIVQTDDREDYVYGMNALTKARSYAAVDLSSIFSQYQRTGMHAMLMLLGDGIVQGYVRPLSRVTYAAPKAANAFKFLAASHRRGSVLLRIEHNLTKYRPKSVFYTRDACQLIVVDDEMLSIRVAERLVARGARHLYIACDQVTPYHLFKIRTWKENGVKSKYFSNNLGNSQNILSLVKLANNIAPVEGIYISLTESKYKYNNSMLSDIVNYFESASRLCSKLKYFALFTNNLAVARNIYLSRSKCNLPVTILHVPILTKVKEYGHYFVDGLEQALCSRQTAASLQIEINDKHSILDELNLITGSDLCKIKQTNKNLAEIGIKKEKIYAIQSLLRNTYHKFIVEDQLFSLTINELKKLDDTTEESFENYIGLQNLYQFIGSDEHLATTPIISLPTLTRHATEMDKIEADDTYFYIIPCMEGYYERFRVLCERLKMSALVLQPGLEYPHDTIKQTAERYSQIILKTSKHHDNFYLLGYGSGTLVALEVAAILEAQGFTGTIFCLGFAPDEFQEELEKLMSEFKTEEELHNSLICHIFTLISGGDTDEVKKVLQYAFTWQQKVDACIRCLLGRKTQSTQYTRAFIEAALARIKQVRGYNTDPFQLQSKLVLLRAATKHVMPPQSVLEKYSHQALDAYQLRLPLPHVQHDTLVAPIINKYLSPEILNSFNRKNLCNVYINTEYVDQSVI